MSDCNRSIKSRSSLPWRRKTMAFGMMLEVGGNETKRMFRVWVESREDIWPKHHSGPIFGEYQNKEYKKCWRITAFLKYLTFVMFVVRPQLCWKQYNYSLSGFDTCFFMNHVFLLERNHESPRPTTQDAHTTLWIEWWIFRLNASLKTATCFTDRRI